MAEIIINGEKISSESNCFVVAEIGQNHQGDVEKAKELFQVAKWCGANAVKLQKRDNKQLYTRVLYDAPYDNKNSFGTTYGEHREALEFDAHQFKDLKQYADEIGITLFATAWDFNSVDLLSDLDMPAYKIASGDLKSIPLLQYIAKINKPMILSTGGATLDDVRRAYDAVMPINNQLCLLQCTAAYPADIELLNLNVIQTYIKEFPDVVVGLSDHENGIDSALVAYMLGARVIEKHFTLNRALKGTDHAFSLEPQGLKKLVRNLRRIPLSLGDGIKAPLETEKKPLTKMGKSIVAACDMREGQIIKENDLAYKSPGDGLPPFENSRIIGKKLAISVQADDYILPEMLQ